ncbi:C2H2-type domain-containing protein [Pleurotus pulmonarius]
MLRPPSPAIMLPLHKKRRIASDEVQEIAAQFDFEISVRERLQHVTEQRIKWAQTLLDEIPSSRDADADSAPTLYKNVALGAWDSVNCSTFVLLDRVIPSSPIRHAAPDPAQSATRSRKQKFLYIKPSEAGDAGLLILKCPACRRTSFTSLQGLLNHARLAHKIEWGTHDDCISACAVVNDQEDLMIEDGLEVGGTLSVLPSLQRLFQSAIRGQSGGTSATVLDENTEGNRNTAPQAVVSTHISRTLGFHAETPALAPFLGKAATRRVIKVWNELEDIDVYGGVDTPSKTRRTGRVLTARNQASLVDDADSIPSPPHDPSQGNIARDQVNFLPSLDPLRIQSSRFYFSTRIIITDRSWYQPPQRRGEGKHTHKWMISVEAPSYSISITSILKALRVSLADNQPIDHNVPEFPSHSCSDPPYVIVGWTSQPFLANVELEFNDSGDGTSKGQIITFEHWVELDQLGVSHPVMGAEQVVDVELEKRMRVLPPRKDVVSINNKSLWTTDSTKVEKENDDSSLEEQTGKDMSNVDKLLNEVVPRFPMTHKDIKSRGRVNLPQLPYTLVLSPDQFKVLNLGRRKAIEWGRARAIRDAYNQAIRTKSPADSRLKTVDVFDWLERKSLFIRDRPSPTTPPITQAKTVENEALDTWCGYCGLQLDDDDAGHASGSCTATQPVSLDILSTLQKPAASTSSPSRFKFKPRSLVVTADPKLTIGVMDAVSVLKLPTFRPHDGHGRFPLDKLGSTVSEVDAQLAPFAALGLTLRSFIKVLVGSALDVAQEDKRNMQRSSGNVTSRQVLTTSHLMRGIARGQQESSTLEAKLLYLSLATMRIHGEDSIE